MRIVRIVLGLVLAMLAICASASAQDWTTVYQTDFSIDPDWETSNPDHYYWDPSTGTYFTNNYTNSGAIAGDWATTDITYAGESFRLIFDVKPARTGGDNGDVCIGLFGPNRESHSSTEERVFILIGGYTPVIYVEGHSSCGETIQTPESASGTMENNQWHHIEIVYDATTTTVSATATRNGTTVFSWSMAMTCGFSNTLTNLGVSMKGSWSTAGRHQAAYIDNVSFALLDCVIDPCTFSDDFEDGLIDPCRWKTGCAARGWDPSQPQGIGDWTCSVDEIVDADGYIQMEVQGPISGNTYGAEAWALASANLNDGNYHVIDFTWEAETVIPGHYDYYYIQITDGFIPELGSVHWPETQLPIDGTVNLALHESPSSEIVPGLALPDGLPKTTWSIVVHPDGTALLYSGPGGTGNLLHQDTLDLGYPWYIRFMVIDATSAGFSAGHDRMKVYDIAAKCGGCCIARVGDANCSFEDEPTIGDVSVMIDAKFITGTCEGILCCLAEADINQSGGCNPTCDDITIGDISVLIDYLFITGPSLGLPECGSCAQSSPAPAAKGSVGVSLVSEYEDGYTTIMVSSAVTLRGLQLQVQGSGTSNPINLTDNRLDLFHGSTDDVIRIGMIDMDGVESIQPGLTPVIRLEGEYEILSALVTDRNHQDIVPTINGATKNELLPSEFALDQNYPNPFNPTTSISFALSQACDVQIDVLNVLGQRVVVLVSGQFEAGEHSVEWDASAQASGVYFYRLTAGDMVETKKMVLLK